MPIKPLVLLANEFGGGRGHMVRLARLGQALGPSFRFEAALGPREYENEFESLGAWVFSGPHLAYSDATLAQRTGPQGILTITWGEYLGDLGFDRVGRIREVVAWWRQVLGERQVALLVADYAPLAQLAARSLGIPCVVTGQGYGLPPADLPAFPVLHPEGTVRLHDESRLLGNVNTVAVEIGLPPLGGLPEIYRADVTLVHTFGFLDPYGSWRKEVCLPPVNDYSTELANAGQEVFVYCSTCELETPGWVEALENLPLPRRGYLLRATPEMKERLQASGMHIESAPVPVVDIVRRSRLLLHAGQHGMLSVGLLSGLPQVAVSQNLEQRFHAQRAQAAGVARLIPRKECTVERLIATVMELYEDAAARQAAAALAHKLRAEMVASPEELLADVVAPIRAAVLASSR